MSKLKFIKASNIKNYLLYGLGEIILVVFGILIALQVNNWNMESQKKDQEIKVLKEINDAFISDTSTMHFFSDRIEFNTRVVSLLLDALESDREYHDSLDNYFAMVVTPFMWSESTSAYETLLARGVDIISNDEIRDDIISIHTGSYKNIDYIDNGVYIKYQYIHEYCIRHFNVVSSEMIDEEGQYVPGRMKPNDYEQLKVDPEYLAILRTVISQQRIFMNILTSTREQLNQAIDKIEKEIALEN